MKYLLILFLLVPRLLLAHCQVPCGIYGDSEKFAELEQHVETIAKAMSELAEQPSANQQVRWVINKESHAQKIQDEAMDYFLTQRIKETQEGYSELLAALHKMVVAAMKCKQSTEASAVEALRQALQDFKGLYQQATS